MFRLLHSDASLRGSTHCSCRGWCWAHSQMDVVIWWEGLWGLRLMGQPRTVVQAVHRTATGHPFAIENNVKGIPWNVKWDSLSPWFLVPVCAFSDWLHVLFFPVSEYWLLFAFLVSHLFWFLPLLSFCIYFWASDIFIWEHTMAKFYPISRY